PPLLRVGPEAGQTNGSPRAQGKAEGRVSADGSLRYRAGECWFPAKGLRQNAASKVAPQVTGSYPRFCPVLAQHPSGVVQGQFFCTRAPALLDPKGAHP